LSEPTQPGLATNGGLGGRLPPSETTKHLAYAEAGIMLMEGLLHLLVARRLLTAEEIVTTIETLIATKQQMIKDGDHQGVSLVATGVLSNLANSVAALDVTSAGVS
jgi:hypothetical protein